MAIQSITVNSAAVLPTNNNAQYITETHQEQKTEEKQLFGLLANNITLRNELHTLLSTLIASTVTESMPREILHNTSTDIQNTGGATSIESSGSSNSQKALQQLQQVALQEGQKLKQITDALHLSAPACKDEHFTGKGLEHKNQKINSTVITIINLQQKIMNDITQIEQDASLLLQTDNVLASLIDLDHKITDTLNKLSQRLHQESLSNK